MAYIYPSPEWLEEGFKAFQSDPQWATKLKKLSGYFAYRIQADEAFGLEKDLYMCMVLDAGKLTRLEHVTEEDAKNDADFVLGATPQVWKRILQKLDKFVGAFMGRRIKLEKGSTVGALALGPHAGTLVNVLTLVDLQFPDDLSPDELAEFKSKLEDFRATKGL
jgi:putative sterol carrier protein